MGAKARRPNDGHSGDGPARQNIGPAEDSIGEREQTKTVSPAYVDDAGIADAQLNEPENEHHQSDQGEAQER